MITRVHQHVSVAAAVHWSCITQSRCQTAQWFPGTRINSDDVHTTHCVGWLVAGLTQPRLLSQKAKHQVTSRIRAREQMLLLSWLFTGAFCCGAITHLHSKLGSNANCTFEEKKLFFSCSRGLLPSAFPPRKTLNVATVLGNAKPVWGLWPCWCIVPRWSATLLTLEQGSDISARTRPWVFADRWSEGSSGRFQEPPCMFLSAALPPGRSGVTVNWLWVALLQQPSSDLLLYGRETCCGAVDTPWINTVFTIKQTSRFIGWTWEKNICCW